MNQNRSLRIGIDGSMDPRGMDLAGRSSRRTLGSGSPLRVVHAEGMPRPLFPRRVGGVGDDKLWRCQSSGEDSGVMDELVGVVVVA